ncbi:MAG: glycosyltransferase family 4 protein [Bryobacteraceae bacterium]
MPTLQLEYSWTPYAESVGGIDSVLNCFLSYAERHWPGRIEVKSLGGAEGGSPARQCAAQTAIRPICERRRSLVPVNLRFLVSLWRNKTPAGGERVLFLQRSDHALAYLGDDAPPLVLYIHGSTEHLHLPSESKLRWLRAVMPLLEEGAIRRARHIFVCSERGRSYYARRYPRCAGRFEVLPGAVDEDRFRLLGTQAARRALGLDENAFLVLLVGRIEEAKDPLLWASAFEQVCARLPNARAAILGTGALAPRMLGWLEEHGLSERLLCCKSVPEAELALWYNAADVLLTTSHFEGSPKVVVEALACGTPVVATDVGDLPEILAYGVPLAICKTRDAEALAEAVLKYAGAQKKECPEFVRSHACATVYGHVLEVLRAVAAGA